MRFEYDPLKSLSNKMKHGIDFDDAQAIWDDTERLVVDATSDVEPRYAVIGKVGEKIWTAICTDRGDSIRIISVRRSRDREVRAYEED